MTSPYGSPPVRPQNAPPAAQMTPGLQPGTDGVIFANIVVIYGPNAGIFIYSPAPGPGNLIGSWAGSAGTDVYGNTYPQGISAAAGALLTIGTTSGGIVTGTAIPADLVTAYGGTMVAVTAFHQSATQYAYQGVLNTNAYVFGVATTGVSVTEAYRVIDPGVGAEISYGAGAAVTVRYSPTTNGVYETGYVEVNQAYTRFESASLVEFFSGSTLQLDASASAAGGAAFSIDGFSAPRGLIFHEQVTAPVNTGAVANTNYAVYTTNAAVTFRHGRAYQLHVMNGKFKSAALQNPHYDLYKGTGVGGTVLVTGPRLGITVAGVDLAWVPTFIFGNTTAADVSTTLTIGIAPSVATLVTLDAGAGAASFHVLIYDIGATADIGGLISV